MHSHTAIADVRGLISILVCTVQLWRNSKYARAVSTHGRSHRWRVVKRCFVFAAAPKQLGCHSVNTELLRQLIRIVSSSEPRVQSYTFLWPFKLSNIYMTWLPTFSVLCVTTQLYWLCPVFPSLWAERILHPHLCWQGGWTVSVKLWRLNLVLFAFLVWAQVHNKAPHFVLWDWSDPWSIAIKGDQRQLVRCHCFHPSALEQ
jgi:hypothetical protein